MKPQLSGQLRSAKTHRLKLFFSLGSRVTRASGSNPVVKNWDPPLCRSDGPFFFLRHLALKELYISLLPKTLFGVRQAESATRCKQTHSLSIHENEKHIAKQEKTSDPDDFMNRLRSSVVKKRLQPKNAMPLSYYAFGSLHYPRYLEIS